MSKINRYLYPTQIQKTLESLWSINPPPHFRVMCVCKRKICVFQMQATGVEDWERAVGKGETSVRPIHTTICPPHHSPHYWYSTGKIFIERGRGFTFRNNTVDSVLSLFWMQALNLSHYFQSFFSNQYTFINLFACCAVFSAFSSELNCPLILLVLIT